MNEPAAYMTKDGHVYKKHQTRPIEADIPLYALREITDEEILALWVKKNNLNGAKDILDFAREFLKKASKK
jgi:hypothetical protein